MGCPGTLPPDGAPCANPGATCSYPSPDPCCLPTEATCEAGRWRVVYAPCGAPPPEAPCPDTPPVDGSACASGDPCGPVYSFCDYGSCPSNGSPTLEAVCDGRSWHVNRYPCDVDAGPVDCSAERQAVVEYAAAHKACNIDSDCTTVYALCAEVADFCDGAVYVNYTLDQTAWKARNQAFYDCISHTGIGCVVCDAIAPPPTCRAGICQAQ